MIVYSLTSPAQLFTYQLHDTLSNRILEAWHSLRRTNPALSSPFFDPHFFTASQKFNKAVEFLSIERNGTIEAIFPFERQDEFVGVPVNHVMNDHHGIICGPSFSADWLSILRNSKLRKWSFYHTPPGQAQFVTQRKNKNEIPIIDLLNGSDRYYQTKRQLGSRLFITLNNLTRRLEKEVGHIEFVFHTQSTHALSVFMSLKSEQYKSNEWPDQFADNKIRGIIAALHSTQEPSFSGVLSELYAGGHHLASHFGLRSSQTLHYWFPTYREEFRKYSPGHLLLNYLISHSIANRISLIDLGSGTHDYKNRFMNDVIETRSGTVEVLSGATIASHLGSNLSRVYQRCFKMMK
ncbi:GNAT family N-acetyltransferase [Aestuariivirga sp.]|uniref:GNAT family N-acetyltransferase n=1 Tax=Aestuariivirga sp. TaxID=2650926 RepID=UPI003BADAFAC